MLPPCPFLERIYQGGLVDRGKSIIFVINREETFARWEKYSSELDMFSLAYSYLCAR